MKITGNNRWSDSFRFFHRNLIGLADQLARPAAIEGAGEGSWTLRILMGLSRFQSKLTSGVWLFRVTALIPRDLFSWLIRCVVLRPNRRINGCGLIPSVRTEPLHWACEDAPNGWNVAPPSRRLV